MTATQIERAPLTETPAMTRLQRALLETQTQILDNAQVEKYQKEAIARKVQAKIWLHRLLLTACLLVVIGFVFCAIFTTGWVGKSLMSAAAVSMLFLAGIQWGDILTVRDYAKRGVAFQWLDCSMGECPVAIPGKVRRLAQRIESRSRKVPFVEYLADDPFLFFLDTQDQCRRYYVAVWDEKGFIQ